MAHENVTVPAKSLVLATLEPVYIISPALQRFGSNAFNPPIPRMLAQPVEPVLETPPCRGSTGVFSPLGMEAGVLTPKNVST